MTVKEEEKEELERRVCSTGLALDKAQRKSGDKSEQSHCLDGVGSGLLSRDSYLTLEVKTYAL